MKREDLIILIFKYWPECSINLLELDNIELAELLDDVEPKEAYYGNNGYYFI